MYLPDLFKSLKKKILYIYRQQMDFTDDEIKLALNRYLKNKEYQKNYYRNKYNEDEEYREKTKQLSRQYYQNNSDKRKEKYEIQKDFLRAKRRFRYWKQKNNIDKFIEKYPEDYEMYFKHVEVN